MESNDRIEAEMSDEPERPEPDRRGRANARWQGTRRWVLIGTVLIAVLVFALAKWPPGGDSGSSSGSNSGANASTSANANTAASPSGTPAASANGVQIPPPSMCMVMPRAISDLAALAGTPAATPAATPPGTIPPPGAPADAATTQKVILTVQVAIACHNAGDYARLFTLYSDHYVHELLTAAAAATQLPPGTVAVLLSTPQPLPTSQWRGIQAMGEVDKLADGRVSVLVVTVDPTRSVPTEPSLMVLVSKNGLWQIDNTIDLGSATPTP